MFLKLKCTSGVATENRMNYSSHELQLIIDINLNLIRPHPKIPKEKNIVKLPMISPWDL
jgi:hypothetical protein